jgi:hypothetical protein
VFVSPAEVYALIAVSVAVGCLGWLLIAYLMEHPPSQWFKADRPSNVVNIESKRKAG